MISTLTSCNSKQNKLAIMRNKFFFSGIILITVYKKMPNWEITINKYGLKTTHICPWK